MTGRELVVLGTGSRAPTRDRNTNGYLFRWDQEAILIDPGEGTQRQMALAGASPHRVTHICLTHLHGDHCLGLPGVLEELASTHPEREIQIHFPASGRAYVERLCDASAGARPPVRLHPIAPGGADREVVVHEGAPLRVTARSLVHPVDTVGYRYEEPPGRHVDAEQLARAGVTGPLIGQLQRAGAVDGAGGAHIVLDDVSETQPGFSLAVVMDTSRCAAAIELARHADLLLSEATFLEAEADLAAHHGHLTASQAAGIAAEAGVGALVLTHFSDRYDDLGQHEREARASFPNTLCARDLQVIPALRYRTKHLPIAATSIVV